MGHKLSEDHKRKISEAHKGKIFSAEHRAAISKSLTGVKHTKFDSGPNKGKKLSEDWKEKMAAAKRGKTGEAANKSGSFTAELSVLFKGLADGYGQIARKVVNNICQCAKRRKKDIALTNTQIFDLIIKPCTYCNRDPEFPKRHNGIDRVDNDIGYELSNCLPCCWICNRAKGNMTVAEFRAWMSDAYTHSFSI